ncbi:MAG: diguanylate cyclase [Aquimonas sp.]|nr:diguanylate cyclase [Aquimonas sp.]
MHLGRGSIRGWRQWPALVVWLLGIFAACSSSAASPENTQFERIGDNDQIPDGVITALAQEADGFLWIGTTEALVRYDGYRFRRYVHDPRDPHSLPSNRVVDLLVASDGRLWVALQSGGVAVREAEGDRFRRFGNAPGLANALPEGQIRALAQTPDGAIWAGSTGQGLARIDSDGTVQVFRHGPEPGALPDDRISALGVDLQGQLWVGSWQGLSRLRSDGAFERVLSRPGDPEGFAGTTIRGIHRARNGDLWIGAQQGQMAVVPAELAGRDEPPTVDEVRRWRGRGLNAIIEPADGSLWLAHGHGIDVYADGGRGELHRIRHRVADALSLPNADIRDLLLDRQGWVWVGSFGGGLLRTQPGEPALLSRRLRPLEDAPIGQLSVQAVAAARGGGLWAGVTQFGLVRMDAALNIIERLPSTSAAESGLTGLFPSGLVETDDGALWVATERGLFRRDPGLTRFALVSGPDFLEGSSIRRLWPAPDDGLWVATGDGLFRVDRRGRALRLQGPNGTRVGGPINALVVEPGGGGYVGGVHGLFRLHPEGTLEPLRLEIDGGIEPREVLGLLLDGQGRLWIDGNGLYRLLELRGDLARLDPVGARRGLGDVAFGANLAEDARGRLWSHRFVFDADSEQFHRLSRADGVRIGTGWFRSMAWLEDGRLAIGGNEGLLVMRPEQFDVARDLPPLVLTELRVDGELRPISARPQRLTLAPDERGFVIEFAGLDLRAPELLRYRYRIQGLDRDWLEVASEARVASYGGLWPGEYRFEVQVGRAGDDWAEPGLLLTVEVQPDWWQSRWVAVLGILLLGLLLAALLRWRERRLRRARVRLTTEVQVRTAELQARTIELQGLSEELARKNRDFEEASLTDPLTGLRNRRFAMQEMPKEAALALRRAHAQRTGGSAHGADLVVFMIDFDHFKTVNDRYGHAAGDAVLCQFAERLRAVFRASDHLVRWGGEEFLVVARDTDRQAAAELAERVRVLMETTPFRLADGQSVLRTVCVGFAPYPLSPIHPESAGWEAAVDLADHLLYACKRAGRNAWIGVFPEFSDRAPTHSSGWASPERVRAGHVRLVSNLPEGRALEALGEQAKAIPVGV